MRETSIPKSRFKLSPVSRPRMTLPMGFVIWLSGGKSEVSLNTKVRRDQRAVVGLRNIPGHNLLCPDRPDSGRVRTGDLGDNDVATQQGILQRRQREGIPHNINNP